MNMTFSDLHCDLLSYLAEGSYRFAYDNECRTSISQFLAGKVTEQTLAVFTMTSPKSVRQGLKQIEMYKQLPHKYEGYFQSAASQKEAKIKTRLALENASSLFLEDEPFTTGLARLKNVVQEVEKPLYISLTWTTENRFGGGNYAQGVGLKEDGKKLLEQCQGLTFAIDLSHASDKLAHDIFDFVDKKKLSHKIIASHSNFRKIQKDDRNLPEEIAQEIVRRKGIIGLAFIKRFIGTKLTDFLKHVEYALKLGYEKHLALGADLFYDKVLPASFRGHREGYFFEGLNDASCYPNLAQLLQASFGAEIAERISRKNLKEFLQ
jgi:membrane dipeptidase